MKKEINVSHVHHRKVVAANQSIIGPPPTMSPRLSHYVLLVLASPPTNQNNKAVQEIRPFQNTMHSHTIMTMASMLFIEYECFNASIVTGRSIT